MCFENPSSPSWLLCVLFLLLGIILSPGSCQNAEPRESFGTRSVARRASLLREELRLDDKDHAYASDASPEGKEPVDEYERNLPETEAEPRVDGNRNRALLLAEGVTNSTLRTALNATATAGVGVAKGGGGTSDGRRKGNGSDRARKKRRRGKGSKSIGDAIEDSRENEIRGKRGQFSEKGNNSTSKRSRDPRARAYRAERRRRRKNRERKRGRKRTRQNEEKSEGRRTSKSRGRMSDAPAASNLRTDSRASEDPLNTTGLRKDRTPIDENLPITVGTTMSSIIKNHSKSPETLPRYGSYVDTVEREFSKQLEREISRTRLEDPSSLENRILGTSFSKPTYKNRNYKETDTRSNRSEGRRKLSDSRYDAEKMLGYTRTEEDLPILDLENEVLARTLKDYNAYMTSNLKLSMLPREEDVEHRKSSTLHYHDKPIIDEPDLGRLDDTAENLENLENLEKLTSTSTAIYDEDNANGDLSCINGTFLPAPLARHALIKYVKSSIPGHEYLEADYECAPGFYMSSATSRLLCKNRRWIGQVPKCKLKGNSDGVCAEASCEHVCKEVDGKALCSCYKGFRLDDNRCIDVNECKDNKGGCEYKCVNTRGSFRCECPKGTRRGENRFTCTDINECLLNNGHGPCQDTCRNIIGGYECSCEGLQDSVLSADNHTCEDSGPCSVNNAGCSHTCLSTMGRVFCLCPDGFILEDDWKTCQDVDECVQPDLQTEMCRYGCINTPGSYRCAEPMELKDQPIIDSLSITCLPGYESTPDGTCIDINECEVDNAGCTEVCENTDGSFFCACDGDEKALSSDGKSCVDINNVACPPLNLAGRGYLMCTRSTTPKPWRGRRRVTNRPGTKCFLKCPHGYQLHGEYELTCRSDGAWDGPKHGECVRYGKPRLECPKDVIAELAPGREEAFVTFDQPSTDLDWFRYVRSKPSWGTRLEANLKPGTHEVTFYARHPVSKKQTSCVLRIIVKEGEAPKVTDCPKDIEVTGRNGTAITWIEPIFTDNVKVARIRSNESPGRRFDVGGHRIEYEAADEAGWSSKCVFTVVLRPK